jgi:hypothetical protein
LKTFKTKPRRIEVMSEAVMEAEKAAAETRVAGRTLTGGATPALSGRAVVLAKYGLRTLQEIADTSFPQTTPLVEHLLSPGETALLIARQKEGKSTFALQLAVDVSIGDPFLDRYKTCQTPVLYVDYENRPYRLKGRSLDIAQGRKLDNIAVVAYERISDRDVSLFGDGYVRLKEIVRDLQPGLLIIDPLRYAVDKDSSEERPAIEALDRVAELREANSRLAVLLPHHLKKAQESLSPQLSTDPRAWIDKVYGSQALLAHVETIWGLEQDKDGEGLTFGTVSRSEETIILGLEKEAESQRFRVSDVPVQVSRMTVALRAAWELLPHDFSRSDGIAKGVANNTLDRLIRQCRVIGLLEQDGLSKRYKKRI